jgi:hypothetical protein
MWTTMTQEQQQYSPGDVVNGHVMTSGGEWVALSSATPEHARQERPRKRRAPKIILGIIAAVIVLVVVIAALGGGEDSAQPAAAESSSESGDTAAPDDAAEPAPVVDLTDFTPVDSTAWSQIAKDPDAASGQKVVVFAEVTQFDSATGTDSFRANTGARQPSAEFELETNAVFGGNGDSLADVTQGDVLRVYAEVSGSLEYETAIGGSTVVPSLDVVSVERVGYLDITGDAVLGTPSWAEYGGVDVPVTVTNSSDTVMTYSVDVVAESPDGTTQLGTAGAYVDNLAPGQSAPTEASFYEDLPADAVIKVVKVERYGS